jgi:hypothetical protein
VAVNKAQVSRIKYSSGFGWSNDVLGRLGLNQPRCSPVQAHPGFEAVGVGSEEILRIERGIEG